MKRASVNFAVDCTAFTAFVLLVSTGILMRYSLPPGSGQGRVIWGLDRHEWGDIHFWVSVAFLLLLALHLVLHWRWVLTLLRGRMPDGAGWRMGIAWVGLIGLLALAAAPLLAPVDRADAAGGRIDRHAAAGLRGTMTLAEIADAADVPLPRLLAALGWPADTPPDAQAGRLCRRYGIGMHELRDTVSALREQQAN